MVESGNSGCGDQRCLSAGSVPDDQSARGRETVLPGAGGEADDGAAGGWTGPLGECTGHVSVPRARTLPLTLPLTLL